MPIAINNTNLSYKKVTQVPANTDSITYTLNNFYALFTQSDYNYSFIRDIRNNYITLDTEKGFVDIKNYLNTIPPIYNIQIDNDNNKLLKLYYNQPTPDKITEDILILLTPINYEMSLEDIVDIKISFTDTNGDTVNYSVKDLFALGQTRLFLIQGRPIFGLYFNNKTVSKKADTHMINDDGYTLEIYFKDDVDYTIDMFNTYALSDTSNEAVDFLTSIQIPVSYTHLTLPTKA